MSKKEKVSLFDKEVITDANYAKYVYDKENEKFKFKLICTGISTGATLLFYLFAFLTEYIDIFETLGILMLCVAVITAVITSPTKILKTAHKIGKVLWFITPIIFADWIMYLFGYWLALVALIFAPFTFALYNLYLSYSNRKAAADFLGVASTFSEQNTYGTIQQTTNTANQTAQSASPAQQPQVYRCPSCGGTVLHGESACKNCGTTFNWG